MDAQIKSMALPFLISSASIAALLIVRGIAFGLFRRWSEKTKTTFDDQVYAALKTPSVYWAVIIGLYVGLKLSDVPVKYLSYITKSIYVLVILSVTITIANLSENILSGYIRKIGLPIHGTGLASAVLKGAILLIGLLVILGVLGISIAPLITALGVGGLALALALQDTLANLFAGIHILVEKSIRPGDFVRLEAGHEGIVEDITWRTTRIRTLPNNIVVIPNNKLSQSVVVNYSLPDKTMALAIPISVGYSTDTERLEGILLQVVRDAIKEVPGLLPEPAPAVRFMPGFGASSLDFTLICQIRDFADQVNVQHEIRKRVLRRFREEGIEIPYPQKTVYLRDERDEKG